MTDPNQVRPEDLRYRLATPGDREPLAAALWSYLKQEREAGSLITVVPRNWGAYWDLAWSYLQGSLFGVVGTGWHGPNLVSCTVIGEDWNGPRFETDEGKVAFCWLVWVHPDYRRLGAATAMLQSVENHLLDMGFAVGRTTTREGNAGAQGLAMGYGSKLVESVWQRSLTRQEKP